MNNHLEKTDRVTDLIPRVLVVDDDPGVRDLLATIMQEQGYRCFTAADVPEARALMEDYEMALVLLDINLPQMNGLEFLHEISRVSSDTVVIMVTAVAEMDAAIEAMKSGAADYVLKPFKVDELIIAARQALEKRELIRQNREFQKELGEKVRQQTVELRRQKEIIDTLYLDTVAAFAHALEAKDRYTEGHSRNVANYSLVLAKETGQSEDFCQKIEWGGFLHDIGKIGTPDAILTKEGALTASEYAQMRKHPEQGWAIVHRIRYMDELVTQCVRSHHERWDGKGYPDGLQGEQIPLPGRILAIADAFDAMTSTRSYRDAMTVKAALAEINKHCGKQFDPTLVSVFLKVMDQSKGGGGNILVVDDEPAITTLFQRCLSAQGHRVVVANTGFQAMRRVTEEPFDIVFLDLNLPGLDGLQTLQQMRELRRDLLIAIITGMPEDERIAAMVREGAVACLPKPFGIHDITGFTSRILEEIRQRKGTHGAE